MFKQKIALVTGGAGGIGLQYVRELLENGIKGVTIIDVNECGKEIEDKLNKEFGHNKVIFLQADVGQKSELKSAFELSFEHWNNLDIVINNAGICNEKIWEKCVSVNCNGTVYGTYLGFEYMSRMKGGKGGVIVNTSSIYGVETSLFFPMYSATKNFIMSFSQALASEFYFKHNGVKVLTLCLGGTETGIVTDMTKVIHDELCPNLMDYAVDLIANSTKQPPQHVAKHVMTLIDKAENGSVWVIEDIQPPYRIYKSAASDLLKKIVNV